MPIGVALLAISKYMKIVNMEGMSRKQLYQATLANPPPFQNMSSAHGCGHARARLPTLHHWPISALLPLPPFMRVVGGGGDRNRAYKRPTPQPYVQVLYDVLSNCSTKRDALRGVEVSR